MPKAAGRAPGTRRKVSVAIIGAGFGGLAAAVKLSQRTSADFVIFEQSESVGGTWWDNRYPGCEVDIHSHAYSFSFYKYDWSRTHARQPELLAYANEVTDKFGLRPHMRLNTRIVEICWMDAERKYRVVAESGEEYVFDVVITAVGLLSVPRYPDWSGLEEFQGIKFHTARWESEHDLAGKVVAVVGTGSTAVQVVPALADSVKHLYVYQREPGWIEPKFERPFRPWERWLFYRVPGLQRAHRARIFYSSMRRFRGYDVNSKRQRVMRAMCERFIQSTIADPRVRDAVTPHYPWGCKRPVVASTFYPALNRPNVDLVPHPVVRVTREGLVDDSGDTRRIDVLVMATGFQPTRFLAGLDITGRDGRKLHDVWNPRPTAFLGITVPGFTNFFILYGPNTNGGLSIIAQLERQAEVAANAVARLQRLPAGAVIDTDDAVARSYSAWIDREISKHASAMESGCSNYYHSADGSNVTQWPGAHLKYLICTRLLWRVGLRTRTG